MPERALVKKIESLIELVSKLVPATATIPILAPSQDHDLLTKLDVKVDALKEDIRILNDGTSSKISDHELRIRLLEKYVWLAIGMLAVLQIVLKLFFK